MSRQFEFIMDKYQMVKDDMPDPVTYRSHIGDKYEKMKFSKNQTCRVIKGQSWKGDG